jgi:nitrite reductase/ring-hydroxylating ferredoxin subunit
MAGYSRPVEWLRVPLVDLDAEGRAVVNGKGDEIAVFLVDGKAHAVANTCPHEGNPLVEGEILGPTLTCAYHTWKFDLETGACLFGDEPVRIYPTELRDGAIWIRLTT